LNPVLGGDDFDVLKVLKPGIEIDEKYLKADLQ
jgi:hypothetical protein